MTEQRLTGLPAATQPPPGPPPRPVLRRLVAVTAALCVAAGVTTYVVRSAAGPSCGTAPVAARALSDLRGYVQWLRDNHARGYVGEVGWPSGADAAQWRSVAQQWYDEADRAGLWVTAWAAGRWWPRSYRMAVYRLDGRRTPATAGPQAAVVQAHAEAGGALRGVDLPSGAFGSGPESPSWYSNARPGRYGTDYYYDGRGDLDQVAATG
ncbi:MAG: endoglucanase, partial [Nocardioidaceae bacterium]|nr:endoglucanase [Nocardioidaceae bacterium]